MKNLLFLLLLSTTFFATGCPKYRPKVDFKNPDGFVNQLNEHIKATQRNYECYLFGPTYPSPLGSCAGYVQNADTAKAIRNELLENALPFVDGAYADFINDLQAGRDRTNFVADVIDLGAAAAVGITNGERALQIIGVAITAFRGSRKSADANFYKEQSTPILISKMDDNRAKVRATIFLNEQNPATDYPLGRAVADIVEYYNAGTLTRAFTELVNDTGAAAQASEAHLKNLRDAGVKGAPTADQIRISTANASELRTLRAAYRSANKSVTDAETAITTATTDIANANAAITTATESIGAANSAITSATTPAAKTQAQADQTRAQGEKDKAEANKTKAEAAKTSAETAKATAITARDQAFNKIKNIYDAIAGDSKLEPVLNKTAEDPSLSPQEAARIKGLLAKNKGRPLPAGDVERTQAVDDYYDILLKFSYIAQDRFKEEPELNSRLQEILKANK